MKISLKSRVALKTIDLLAVNHGPAFVIPEGTLTIQSIGRFEIAGFSVTNIYVEDNNIFYMIQVWEKNGTINHLALAQNVLYATPQTKEEWDEAYTEASGDSIQLDDVTYTLNTGNVKGVFVKYQEVVTSADGTRTVSSEMQSFGRPTSDIEALNKTENLYVAFEVDEQRQSAGIAYYLGYTLDPTCLTVGG